MKSAIKAPLIVITGPTASGKSGLALELAEELNGEIICADSRTIYKGMDIGTAKPTLAEQKRVRHWLIDMVEPGERFTAADFQKHALTAIDDIRLRSKIPFLVGGSGLYIDAVILGFNFASDADTVRRTELEKMTIEQLQALITKQQLTMPENSKNKRYLIRCIEKNNASIPVKTPPDEHTYVFAIETSKLELEQRIRHRIETMFASGLLKEAQQLFEKYGTSSEAMTGNVYPIAERFLKGEINEVEAKELCAVRDRQLVKKQITWLKRHDYVNWLDKEGIRKSVERVLRGYRSA